MNLPIKKLSWDASLFSEIKRSLALSKRKGWKVVWRKAVPEEYDWLKAQPKIEELGDFLYLAPAIEGELWLLIERTYHGFPDPPAYAFLAFDKQGKLLAGGDFNHVPEGWDVPE